MTGVGAGPSPIRREFLGWDQAVLPRAAGRLAERYRQARALDLSAVIVVVPGQRAGRRLQELLVFQAEEERLCLNPPRVVTEGRLAELLYSPKLPFAGDLVQDLAWAQALRELPPAERKHVVPYPPPQDEVLPWVQLGQVVRRLHTELAADGLDFAAVLRKGLDLAVFGEAQRWQTLVNLQRRYLELLDSQGLWDIQTARLKAIELREVATNCDIILLATVDLNDSLRKMLAQIADRVACYVAAPESLADRFDAQGCLVPEAWRNAEIALQDDQLRHVDGPEGQVQAVSEWLGEIQHLMGSGDVVIGVPDEALVPRLQRHLDQHKVRARWVQGRLLGETAPYRLLEAAVEYCRRRGYEELAALIRHPDVEHWLESAGGNRGHPSSEAQPSPPSPPVSKTESARRSRKTAAGDPGQTGGAAAASFSLPGQLDLFYNHHLPSRINVASIKDNPDNWPGLKGAIGQIESWLGPLSDDRPLREWGQFFSQTLATVYGDRVLQLDTATDDLLHFSVRKIVDSCNSLGELPAALDPRPLAAAEAFYLAMRPLAKEAATPPADAEAIEILGWLELPLDDAPGLVITSFNEGLVPKAASADPFLPDRLRVDLGIMHNQRRYARDAYATSVLCHSRQNLRVVFARRDTANDPLHPSRLIFACQDETLVRRARMFFNGTITEASAFSPLIAGSGPIAVQSQFARPTPTPPLEGPSRISVTRFKDYLACPYRYYLRHVCKLQSMDDSARELDGALFGTLIHGALSALGRDRDAPRSSTIEREVFDFLNEQLRRLAELRFGAVGRRPSIRLQVEQARKRLRSFAAQQVMLVLEGWQIVYTEEAAASDVFTGEICVPFLVDNASIDLIGRIDRIDFHEINNALRILDYKTGDTAQNPEKVHRTSEGWIDLQLPLYRHLLAAVPLGARGWAKVELGYFNLPKALDETCVVLAEWDAEALHEADEQARDVIRKLGRGVFWPPTYPAPAFAKDFAAICQDNVLSKPDLGDDPPGGSP